MTLAATGATLSAAYVDLLRKVRDVPGRRATAATIHVPAQDGALIEDALVRAELDRRLRSAGGFSVRTVANTIFPSSLWAPGAGQEQLYRRFLHILPRLKRVKQNARGTYFERMVAFQPGSGGEPINQLRHVIATYRRGNHRASALQVGTFNPATDHSHSPRLGFPCLQQVAFPIDAQRRTIHVVAFYALQYLFAKAYGNYLGLGDLGRFVAHETGCTLSGVTCLIGTAAWDGTKRQLDEFLVAVERPTQRGPEAPQ